MQTLKINSWVTIKKALLIRTIPRCNQLGLVIDVVDNRYKIQLYYLDKTKLDWPPQWFELSELKYVEQKTTKLFETA